MLLGMLKSRQLRENLGWEYEPVYQKMLLTTGARRERGAKTEEEGINFADYKEKYPEEARTPSDA